MPRLKNVRHERFALLLAAGKSQMKAYVEAGYRPHNSNPAHLAKDKRVQARVAELIDQQRQRENKALVRAAETVAISKGWVLDRLRENAERAMQIRPVCDSEGREIGQFHYDGSVANRALELIGRELGMFVNRGELKVQHDYAGMTDEQRMRWAYGVLAQARAVLDAPDESAPPLIESEPQGA